MKSNSRKVIKVSNGKIKFQRLSAAILALTLLGSGGKGALAHAVNTPAIKLEEFAEMQGTNQGTDVKVVEPDYYNEGVFKSDYLTSMSAENSESIPSPEMDVMKIYTYILGERTMLGYFKNNKEIDILADEIFKLGISDADNILKRLITLEEWEKDNYHVNFLKYRIADDMIRLYEVKTKKSVNEDLVMKALINSFLNLPNNELYTNIDSDISDLNYEPYSNELLATIKSNQALNLLLPESLSEVIKNNPGLDQASYQVYGDWYCNPEGAGQIVIVQKYSNSSDVYPENSIIFLDVYYTLEYSEQEKGYVLIDIACKTISANSLNEGKLLQKI